MSEKLNRIINLVIVAFGGVYFFLFPLFFLTNTSEFVSYNKLILTILTAVVMAVLWSVRTIVSKKLVFVRNQFNLGLALLILSLGISTVRSVAPYVSIFGSFNTWHLTLVEMLSFIAIFAVLISTVKELSQVRLLIYAFVFSSFILSILAILVFFNVFDGKNFEGVASIFNVFSVDGFSPAGNAPSLVTVMLASVFLQIYMLFISLKNKSQKSKLMFSAKTVTLAMMIVPVFIAMIIWLVTYFPGLNSRQNAYQQLNFQNSWRVAVSSIKEYPFWGTGPSTYSSAYNAFRPATINQTAQWNISFNQSGSEFMTILTTLGGFGLVAFMLLVYKIVKNAISTIKSMTEVNRDAKSVSSLSGYLYPVAYTSVAIVLMLIFTSSTVTSLGVLMMFLTMWVIIENINDRDVVSEVSVTFSNIKAKLAGNKDVKKGTTEEMSLALIVAVPVLFVALAIAYFTIQDFRSNTLYTGSIRMINDNAPVKSIYDAQQGAINLNARRGPYRLIYANTNLSFAELLAKQSGTDIDEATQNDIVQLIQQSIREVRIATEVIDPTSINAWQTRGNIYTRLLGVSQDAFDQAKQSFETAIQLSPLNPVLRKYLGDLYQSYGLNIEKYIPQDQLDKDNPSETIKQQQQTYFSLAEQSYNAALQLKPDYADAHYSLGRLYLSAGANDPAKRELQTTLNLLPSDSSQRDEVQGLLDGIN